MSDARIGPPDSGNVTGQDEPLKGDDSGAKLEEADALESTSSGPITTEDHTEDKVSDNKEGLPNTAPDDEGSGNSKPLENGTGPEPIPSKVADPAEGEEDEVNTLTEEEGSPSKTRPNHEDSSKIDPDSDPKADGEKMKANDNDGLEIGKDQANDSIKVADISSMTEDDMRMLAEPMDMEVDVTNPSFNDENSFDEGVDDDLEIVEEEADIPYNSSLDKLSVSQLHKKYESRKKIKKRRKKSVSSPKKRKSGGLAVFSPSSVPKVTGPRLEDLMKPFDNGWTRELVLRGTDDGDSKRGSDVYYFAPNMRKLRSRKEIETFMKTNHITDLDISNFSFEKRTIHKEPYDIVRMANNRKRPLGVSPKGKGSSVGSAKKIKLTPKTPKAVPNKFVDPIPGTPQSTSTPVVILKPVVTKKRAVAKKRTGGNLPKKSEENSGGMDPLVLNLLKPVPGQGMASSISSKTPGTEEQLCSLACAGREGMPPTLHCSVCMCLFHPECVKFERRDHTQAFVCKGCKGDVPDILAGTNSKEHQRSKASSLPPTQQRHMKTLPMNTAPVAVIPSAVSTHKAMPSPTVALAPATTQITAQVNPKQITGQILTLPPHMVGRLNLSEPIGLKLNNQTIMVPTSCFIVTPDGIKIFLPPGTFPGGSQVPTLSQASVQIPGMPTSTSKNFLVQNGNAGAITPLVQEKATSTRHSTVQKDGMQGKITQPASKESSANRTLIANLLSKEPVKQSPTPVEVTPQEVTPLPKKRARVRPQDCFIHKLHAGFDCMLHIFHYLGISDLLRAMQVCRTWRRIASYRCLWRRVKFRNCRVSDWDKAAMHFTSMGTERLDIRGLLHYDDKSRTWHQLTAILNRLYTIRHLEFGQAPASILHAVADNMKSLQTLNAEYITDSASGVQAWNTNTKLDFGRFSLLKDLTEMKLRGVHGLVVPSFSYYPGLTLLSELTKLKVLSLTTLRDIPSEEFTFLTSLENLEFLELGECSTWTAEVFASLGRLEKLRALRLEHAADSASAGLSESLPKLMKLHTLELIHVKVKENLSSTLEQLKTLRSFSIWPDVAIEGAQTNTNTLNAVVDMTFLKNLEWGIVIDSATSNPHSSDESQEDHISGDESNKKGASDSQVRSDCLAFLPENENKDGEEVNLLPEYRSIQQVVERLCTSLPNTKLRVFKVPVRVANKRIPSS